MTDALHQRFHDAARLHEHAQVLHALADAPRPAASLIAGTEPPAGGRLGLLAGSFNPPTLAHVTLAEAGWLPGRLDRVYSVLSTRTVDKEIVSGAAWKIGCCYSNCWPRPIHASGRCW